MSNGPNRRVQAQYYAPRPDAHVNEYWLVVLFADDRAMRQDRRVERIDKWTANDECCVRG